MTPKNRVGGKIIDNLWNSKSFIRWTTEINEGNGNHNRTLVKQD